MRKFFSVIFDEIKNFLKDDAVTLVVIIGVIAYSLCYALPYYKEVIREIPVGVINMDTTDFSREFIRSADASDSIDITLDLSCQKDAEDAFYNGKIKGFIIIPKNFERDILRGKQVNVSFYGDSAYLIVYKTMYQALLDVALENGAKIEIYKMLMSGFTKERAKVTKEPFELVETPLFNPMGGYKSYVYPAILILILHQTFILAIGLRQGNRNEKKEKYCKNAKDIPLTILGRTTAYVLIYCVYAMVAFLMFPQMFDYPIYYNILPLCVIYLLMMYAVGFFAQTISYFFNIKETIILLMVPCSIVFLFLSGLIWPRETMPFLINIVSFLIPSTCGIDGIIKINQNGARFFNIICDFWWLLFLCVTYFVTAVIVTKKLNGKFEDKK